MKGYIYTMYQGADPGAGWVMTDPIFSKVPTLGACMPNIRRAVSKGDYIFSISGRISGFNQYIVGGMNGDEKIDALAAYKRFPQNRMIQLEDGAIRGNIIVDKNGNPLDFDYHTNHERRVENFIVGKDPIVLDNNSEIEQAREESLGVLNKIFQRDEEKISKIIGRWRKLDEAQINEILAWMKSVKG